MSYVTAILKIPIEMIDNKPNLLTNYTEIEFEKCDTLPPKKNNPNLMILDKFINKNEINTNIKRSKNTSFKNNKNIKNIKKFTLKSLPQL